MFGERPCPLTEHSYGPYAVTISPQEGCCDVKIHATSSWILEYKVLVVGWFDVITCLA